MCSSVILLPLDAEHENTAPDRLSKAQWSQWHELDGTAITAISHDMKPTDTQPLWRFLNLALGVLRPPAGAWRITVAFFYGALCHMTFAAAVLSMGIAMFFGMSQSFGRVPGLWAILANAALIR